MSMVRTIRKPPLLMQIMKAAGGVHARTALAKAYAVMKSARAAHVVAIAELLVRLGAWRDLAAPSEADWAALREAGAEIIGLCDAEEDAHLLRAARLLCEYVDRTGGAPRAAAIGVLFINTMKAVATRDVDDAAQAEVMRGLEALIPRQSRAPSPPAGRE